MSTTFTRIAVKIGSNVLTRVDGTLDITRMSALVDQLADLRHAGIDIILISSGAVAAGRSELTTTRHIDSVAQRQLFSAVGQAKLINRYYELFREHGIAVGQVLATKESFGSRRHYLNQRACMQVMLENGVLPIVNENDTISISELMFTDNDELSGLIATMMNVDALIILSNIDGIYTGNPNEANVQLISEITPDMELSQYVRPEKSNFGRGGMLTKTRIARKVAAEGITVWITNGRTDGILTSLIYHPEQVSSTRFVASPTTASSVKKWIAHSESFCKGTIRIDQTAANRVRSEQAVSILPIGVTAVEGTFEKDDLVQVIDPQDRPVGIGKVNCDADSARKEIGQRDKKPIIHYDFLYIE